MTTEADKGLIHERGFIMQDVAEKGPICPSLGDGGGRSIGPRLIGASAMLVFRVPTLLLSPGVDEFGVPKWSNGGTSQPRASLACLPLSHYPTAPNRPRAGSGGIMVAYSVLPLILSGEGFIREGNRRGRLLLDTGIEGPTLSSLRVLLS
ncbi:hypothetical protein HAX54_035529 [Datura stramonium]|uniref:Uncharacterized protein n=1 Tax=Datura stramonium TaxID=4076 RepID=A0ABS8VI45_DATST|nr:hypothetical protein [Datura stramonium]